MQDLDNNMDDLFRKAAENYPLKSGKNGWDEIAAALSGKAAIAAKKKNSTRKYSVLLLFLIAGLSLAGGLIINTTAKNKITGSIHERKTTKIDQIPGASSDVNDVHSRAVEGGNSLLKLKPAWQVIGKSSLTNKTTQSPAVFESENGRIDDDRVFKRTNIAENHDYIQLVAPYTDEENDPEKNILANPYEAIQNINQQGVSFNDKNIEGLNSRNPSEQTKGFYFGFAAGPAFSEVKNQGLKKAGFDAGLLAGYRLNHRFSVETGLLFSKKYYYSDGKYFNMKMPSMDVLSVEGSSDLVEIPVKIRYNLMPAKKNQITIGAGLSSFILTKEKNDYLLLVNGIRQNMTSIYKDGHSYFGASVNLSAGYERKISRYLSVRVEPYLKIPLKGIGVGTMQVMSTGLQIAVTRQSH